MKGKTTMQQPRLLSSRKRCFWACLAVAVFTLVSHRAVAFTVYDPANHATNVLIEVHNLAQLKHMTKQIFNQSLMLQALGFHTTDDVYWAMQRMHKAMNLRSPYNAIPSAFENLYPQNFHFHSRHKVQRLRAQWSKVTREAAWHAMHTQAAVVDAMPQVNEHVRVISEGSAQTAGVVGSVQANTQMLSHLANQLQQLQAMTASAHRLEAAQQAQRSALENYFRDRRREMHRDDTRTFQRVRVADPFPRAN